MYRWFEHPLDARAPQGGETGVNDRFYKGGEFMPFYVPRDEMPQVNDDDYRPLRAFLRARGVSMRQRYINPATRLRPHQRVDPAHLKECLGTPAFLARAVLFSQDYYIPDGHHRWKAHCLIGKPLDGYMIVAEFEKAISLLFAYGDSL